MREDSHLSTHAKVAALEIVARLKSRYDLPSLDPKDLYAIAECIDTAISDAANLERIRRAVVPQPLSRGGRP